MNLSLIVLFFDVLADIVEFDDAAAVGEQFPLAVTHGSVEVFIGSVAIDRFCPLKCAVFLDSG